MERDAQPRRAVRAADDQRAPLGAPRPARRRRARGDAVCVRRRQGVLVGLGRRPRRAAASSPRRIPFAGARAQAARLPGRLDGDHRRGRLPLQPHPRARRRLRGAVQESARGDARTPCGVAAREGRRSRDGARGDRRLSPRAGFAGARRARARRPRRRGARRARGRASRRRGQTRVDARRRARCCDPPRPGGIPRRRRRAGDSAGARHGPRGVGRSARGRGSARTRGRLCDPARRHPARRPRGRRAGLRTVPHGSDLGARCDANAGRAGDRDAHGARRRPRPRACVPSALDHARVALRVAGDGRCARARPLPCGASGRPGRAGGDRDVDQRRDVLRADDRGAGGRAATSVCSRPSRRKRSSAGPRRASWRARSR